MNHIYDLLEDDSYVGLSILAGILFVLLSLFTMVNWVWTSSIPAGSPTTTISDHESHDGTFSYIEVQGREYTCEGSDGRIGTRVIYDPVNPSRCRAVGESWVFVGGERLGFAGLLVGLGALLYAFVSLFFLGGGRVTDAQRMAVMKSMDVPTNKRRRGPPSDDT